MNIYLPPGFDEDKYFGDESDCAPLTAEQIAYRERLVQALATLFGPFLSSGEPGINW